MDALPEPWLRGAIAGVDPLTAPLLFTFQQAVEDLSRHTEGLTLQQIWATPHGFGSVGFHLRHIAGSTDRLMTYSQGEHVAAGADREALLALVEQAFQNAAAMVRALDPGALREPRTVGRQHLPTTVAGLLVHIAEHTQRHVGQAISAAKLARVSGSVLPG
jgi:uncharacterized damage-inducible protein DinB